MLFAKAPSSVGEAATRGDADLKRLHHHVGSFRRAGLLKLVGERPHRGCSSA